MEKIKITNFKNYTVEIFDFTERINCIVGENGVGKTNLLDAIYYLCLTKSFFNTPDRVVLAKDKDFFRVEGVFDEKTIVVKYPKGKKKIIEKNGKVYDKIKDHIGLLPIVMIVPSDVYLVREGSEGRRKFLDNTIAQFSKAYLDVLIDYNKLLKQRNAHLKSGMVNDYLLEIYTKKMTPLAEIIFNNRKEFLLEFIPIFQKLYKHISNGNEKVSLAYKSQLLDSNFQEGTQHFSEKDRILQRTNFGIHKDDLVFKLESRSLKQIGSEGQIKSYVLALKLAQYQLLNNKTNKKTILIFDDLFDKLDEGRILCLLELIKNDTFGKVFISDAHLTRISEFFEGLNVPYNLITIK